MQTITIIGTRHQELGLCTSNVLFNILESIQPEIIFEELPPNSFDAFYTSSTKENLESNAIKLYKNNYQIIQVPVDSDNVPSEDFFKTHETAMRKFEDSISEESNLYKKLSDANKENTFIYEFNYLNSGTCIEINNMIKHSTLEGIKKLNNQALLDAHNTWLSINHQRENIMLENIYQYCKTHDFERAVFTVGAAHLNGLKLKIDERLISDKNSINWMFYNQD